MRQRIDRKRQTIAARKLREWRAHLGLPQAAAAEIIGCTQQQVSRYETGSETPSLERAMLIAEVSKGLVPLKDWRIVRDNAP